MTVEQTTSSKTMEMVVVVVLVMCIPCMHTHHEPPNNYGGVRNREKVIGEWVEKKNEREAKTKAFFVMLSSLLSYWFHSNHSSSITCTHSYTFLPPFHMQSVSILSNRSRFSRHGNSLFNGLPFLLSLSFFVFYLSLSPRLHFHSALFSFVVVAFYP